jgi:hypothetical protein
MFRRALKGMHLMLGVSEALAHLECLVYASRLRRVTDAAGVVRYVAVEDGAPREPGEKVSMFRPAMHSG